jgi:NADH-quinone oxidoreductase subunit N
MILSQLTLEIAVAALAIVLLLLDLWLTPAGRRALGWVAMAGLVAILVASFSSPLSGATMDSMLAQDGLAIFFQRFFLVTAIFVLFMGNECAEQLSVGIGEFHVIVLTALVGMMLAAAANDFVMVFVALELMAISFYILVSFQRTRLHSLEAGVKYLIQSALSAAFLVFGIALIFGTANGHTNFVWLNESAAKLNHDKVYWLGILLVLFGLSFKISAFPLQVWTPDVYQGAPTPVTAFLAIGSKAAGFVLLLRVLFLAMPLLSLYWDKMLMLGAGITILYGNLCAIPQRNLKRLLGYSSIANAGYLLLGVAAVNASGSAAVLYYLTGYLFTLAAAFLVICVVMRDNDEIGQLAGLGRRSPLLAGALTLAMVSLGGIPPLAGFLGKFLLLRALVERGAADPAAYWLAGVTVVGVVISLYYYFSVVRVMYWAQDPPDLTPIIVPARVQIPLAVCMVAMLYLGMFPGAALDSAMAAVKALKF